MESFLIKRYFPVNIPQNAAIQTLIIHKPWRNDDAGHINCSRGNKNSLFALGKVGIGTVLPA